MELPKRKVATDVRGIDPLGVAEALDAACNAQDLTAVMELFADDAVAKLLPAPPDGGVYRGKEQVRAWFAPQLAGFHVVTHDRQTSGETVTWTAMMIDDVLRRMGVAQPVEASVEAVVRGGKIVSFTVTNPAVIEAQSTDGVDSDADG